LNASNFEQCLSSNKHLEKVERDLEAGANLGVTGTPAYFINGIRLSGAVPIDRFRKIIEEELSAAKN
jgi:protein-disulfide isomerase